MRTPNLNFTITDINALGAGNVFTITATALCRLLKRIHGNVTTLLFYITPQPPVCCRADIHITYTPQGQHAPPPKLKANTTG